MRPAWDWRTNIQASCFGEKMPATGTLLRGGFPSRTCRLNIPEQKRIIPYRDLEKGWLMRRRWRGVGLAFMVLICPACGGRNSAAANGADRAGGEKPSASASLQSAKAIDQSPTLPAIGPATPVAEVLRYPDPGEGPWKQWVTETTSSHGEEEETRYRVPGDGVSKYYVINAFIDHDAGSTEVLDDKNEVVAEFYLFSDIIGIRKSSRRIDIFALHWSEADGLATYEVLRIENGRELSYYCSLDWSTLAPAVGGYFKTVQQRVGAVGESSHAILNLLTSTEPNLQRDHCKQNDF